MSDERTCHTCNRETGEGEDLYCDFLCDDLPGVMHNCDQWEPMAAKEEPDDINERINRVAVEMCGIRDECLNATHEVERRVDGLSSKLITVNANLNGRLQEAHNRIDTCMDRLDQLGAKLTGVQKFLEKHMKDTRLNMDTLERDLDAKIARQDAAIYQVRTKSMPYGPGADEDGWPIEMPCDRNPRMKTGGIPNGVGSD